MSTLGSAQLAGLLLASGARRVAFLGLAKNVGKTTALVSVLSELAGRGVRAGATSAGRDGESIDGITGEPKPRFRFHTGQLAASASGTFRPAPGFSDPVAVPGFETRFGPIEVRRCDSGSDLEVIGPSTASELARTCEALEAASAEMILIDGAIGRRAFASARVADGVVLSVGLAAAGSVSSAVEGARLAAELIRLPAALAGDSIREFPGALTDSSIEAARLKPGEVVVAEDFASIFLSPGYRRRLSERGVTLAVKCPARLLAVTANPTAPFRPTAGARAFFDAVGQALPDVALFDVVAGMARPGRL